MFPTALLAKLFVKGSLKNTDGGFEMKLKNIIDSGTLTGIGALVVDETSHPPASLTVKTPTAELPGDQISANTPLPVRSSSEIALRVAGEPLLPGAHKITIQIITREVGKLQFSVTETLTE
jgi:hypothetical protein